MKPVYSLNLPGNSTLEISHDELRSLLGDIESDLHRSKVYCRAMAILQKMLGDSAEQAKQLFKVIGREAIGLTFQHFVEHPARLTENTTAPDIGEATASSETEMAANNVQSDNSVNTDEQNSQDLSECLIGQKLQAINPQSQNKKPSSPLGWLTNSQKISKAELEQQAAIARQESLQRIGQQLRAARNSQGLSLNELHVYTHVPIHQMESIENGDWDKLPEEVFVRGFIRVMGNSLGLNGTHLAASLPASHSSKNAIATFANKNNSRGLSLEFNPMHLYFGYTAVVASAVGGLSFMSHYTEAQKQVTSESEAPKSSTFEKSVKETQNNSKPGLQSSTNGITVGNDIAPPEAV